MLLRQPSGFLISSAHITVIDHSQVTAGSERLNKMANKPLVHSSGLRVAARHLPSLVFARGHTIFEETALHRIARQGERLAEVLARDLASPAAKFELAERRMVKRI